MDYSAGTIVEHVDENWMHHKGVVLWIAENHKYGQTGYYVDWARICDKHRRQSTWHVQDEIIAISHIDFEDRIRDRM